MVLPLRTLTNLTRKQLSVPFTDWQTLLAFEKIQLQVAQIIPETFAAFQNLDFVVTSADPQIPNAHVITEGANIDVAIAAGLVTITATPSGASGQIQYNNAGTFGAFTTSGDATINTSTGVLTLATVNANVGSFGDSLHVATFTVNAKGLTTAAASVAIPTFAGSTIGLVPASAGGTVNYLRADGTFAAPPGSGGTTTSVGLSAPAIFTVSGSPVTTSGTLTFTLNTQSANLIWAGPTTGAAVAPTFRAMVAADLPSTAVTPGAYTNLNATIDAQGRVTAASNGSAGAGTVTNVSSANSDLTVATGTTTPVLTVNAAPKLTNWFNVKDYGATGNGSTDDTTAIQNAINACGAGSGGTVYFPRGVYVVGGALQDTSRSNAQLVLPIINAPATEAISIVLRGEGPPPPAFSVVGATPLYVNLSVIKGTLNTGSGTSPCMIGVHGPSGSADDFSNILVTMRDLTVQMPANPVLTAIDCSKVAYLDVDGVAINAGNFDLTTIALQTTSQSCGLRAPGNNNGALTRLGVVSVIGFYNGYQIGEHCVAQDVSAWACRLGYVILAGNHACNFNRLMAIWCKNGIVTTGAASYFDVEQFDIEHAASGTWTPTYDIDDGSNYGHGSVRWHVVLAGVGPDNTFLINGAANLSISQLDQVSVASIASADGSISVTSTRGAVDLSAVKSPKLTTARTFTYTGDATGGPTSFDGSANVSTGLTLATTGVSAGTYTNATVTVDAKGRVTAISAGAAPGGYIPLVTGAEPPILVSDGAGHLITVGYAP